MNGADLAVDGVAVTGGPLSGVSVVEAGGIGPGPFAAMLLADLGAEVIRIDAPAARADDVTRPEVNLLMRGRRSVGLDLKTDQGRRALLQLIDGAEVLVEGFRPGVAERLGFGPEVCLRRNPRLVYGRVTGWGRDGELAAKAGHDINYIALAGVLAHLGMADGPPMPPLNLVGDFAGGGMLLAFGITSALVHVGRCGVGQVVDAAMVDGAALLMTLMHGLRASGTWSETRGANLLDGGAPFYRTYETSDGRYVAVGAAEPKFFAQLLTGLGLGDRDDLVAQQYDRQRWPGLHKLLENIFRGQTLAEWCSIFATLDGCVTPVLTMNEAPTHPHNAARSTFVSVDGVVQPGPAPRFSKTPAHTHAPPPRPCQHTRDVLSERGFSDTEIDQLLATGAAVTEHVQPIESPEPVYQGWPPVTALTTPDRNRTFVQELQRQADHRPDGVYLWHDGVPTTFGEQRARACSVANQLGALGISRGDRVATFAGNCASFVDLWLGAPQAGVMNVLLNTALRGSFLAHQLRDCRAKMVFADDDLLPRLGAIADDLTDLEVVVVRDRTGSDGVAVASELLPGRTVVPASIFGDGDTETWPAIRPLDWNEPSLVVYTSGTTGRSKGVVQTQHYLCAAAEAMNEAVRTTADDVQYSALPLFHNAGIMGVLTTSLLARRPTALDSGFRVSTCWDRIRAVNASQFLAVGPMLKMLYGLPPSPEDALLPLRAIIGAPFPADFHRDLERRYHCRVVQGYAMTEVTFVAVHRLDGSTVVPGSAGPISPLYDVDVFDEDDRTLPAGNVGEIVVRPRHPHVMFESYLDLPDQTQAQMRNLWFHTGDLGRFDDGGNLFFVDRKKDAMRLRGENVSSFEVEESVGEHPAIVECAAIAVPSPLGEDDIKICVVLEQGSELTPEQLLDHCVGRMPRFAVPRYVEFVDALPRTPTMRIQKFLLRDEGVTPTTWDRETAGYVVPR